LCGGRRGQTEQTNRQTAPRQLDRNRRRKRRLADAALAHEHDSRARVGGSFRYSMTTGSSPLRRIMASVLRDVPQAGLW